MAQTRLTIDMMHEAIAAYKAHGSKAAAAVALGLHENTFRHRFSRAVAAGLDDDLVHPAPVGHRVKGVSTLYGSQGNVISQWVKTSASEPSIEGVIEAVTGALEAYSGKSQHTPFAAQSDAETATIYPLPDFHIGLLSWRLETGEDWDLSIAQAIIRTAMQRLVSAAPPSSQAVVLGLGDLLHSDGYDPVTSRSKNQLDVDGRWPKVLRAAVDLLIEIIEMALVRHETVLVRILPGNHDEESSIAVALALSMFYSNNPRVQVDDDPSRFWWWSFGTTLLGATHGDKAKMRDLPLVMASRNPEAWGRAKHRHIYTGHIHTQTGIEASGVTVESFRTPVAPDAYHHSHGYGAGRSVTAITIHNSDGEIQRTRASIVTR